MIGQHPERMVPPAPSDRGQRQNGLLSREAPSSWLQEAEAPPGESCLVLPAGAGAALGVSETAQPIQWSLRHSVKLLGLQASRLTGPWLTRGFSLGPSQSG